MKRKAQIQLGENVVILVIFFFLLVIAVIFYSGIQKNKIITKTYQADTNILVDSKTMIASMPELLCTENGDVTESCIDLINLDIMTKHWNGISNTPSDLDRAYYVYRFGTSQITIRELDTFSGAWINSWTFYNNTEDMNYSRVVYIPISLHNVTNDDYRFGVLEYRRFSKLR